MNIVHLHLMADQIARNLAVRGHHQAVTATADHIATFWDPRMKAAIVTSDRTQLSAIAQEAVRLLERGKVPLHQSGATEFNAVDEAGHSDAG